MPRVRLATDERRALLLKLGVDLFARHTYDALTTDIIATEGSISKGLLFHYFGSKRGFYLATIKHVAGQLLAEVKLDPQKPPSVAVTDAVERFLDFVCGHASIYRALLRGGLGADPDSQGIVERVRWTIVRRVLVLLGDELEGEADDGTPVVTLFGLRLYGWVGLTEALSLAWIDHEAIGRHEARGLMMEGFVPVLTAWARRVAKPNKE